MHMNFRSSFVNIHNCKRFSLIFFLTLITLSFLNKNVLSDYFSDTPVELVELMENGEEENESEREEVKEEMDDYTSAIIHFVFRAKVEIEYVLNNDTIWNSRYSEVLTPPPDKA